jgi:pimeloyl-ACP methyl ester carboxylesterase
MVTSTARDTMLAGLPGVGRVLDIDGIATSVWEAGDGPPLVLLHGAIECGGAMWAPVVGPLAKRYRVVVPDVPGLGESAPVDRLDVVTFGTWWRGLVRRLGLDRPAVIAHSLVGSLTTRFATRHDDTIGRLVVYGAPAVGPFRVPMRLRVIAIRFALRPTPANVARFERFALFDREAARRRDPDWFDAFSEYTRTRAQVRSVKRTMGQLLAAETKPIPDADLARIRIPVTLVWGRRDRMVPLATAEAAAARHGWPLRIVEGVGHVPHIEAPAAFLTQIEPIVAR